MDFLSFYLGIVTTEKDIHKTHNMPIEKKVIKRYRLLDTSFKRSEGFTYDEILDILQDNGITISDRTLKEDIRVFKEQYKARFVQNIKRNRQIILKYENPSFSIFTATVPEEEKHRIKKIIEKLYLHDDIPQFQWMLCMLEGLVHIDNAEDIAHYIEFDNNLNLDGLDCFKQLLEACMNKYVISLEYAPYKHHNTPKTYIVSPYRLQQYNKRWFLICKIVGYNSITTFAFDRIKTGSIHKESAAIYENPDWEWIEQCLSNSIGITDAFSNCPNYDVKLLVSKERYNYIKTKPIVQWQEELTEENTDNCVCILLKDIKINKELKSLILSYGEDIEIIHPNALRNEIKKTIQSLNKIYSAMK